MAILALQAISNLIYDWNTDQGEQPLVEDLDDLLARTGANHLDARPVGDGADRSGSSAPTQK